MTSSRTTKRRQLPRRRKPHRRKRMSPQASGPVKSMDATNSSLEKPISSDTRGRQNCILCLVLHVRNVMQPLHERMHRGDTRNLGIMVSSSNPLGRRKPTEPRPPQATNLEAGVGPLHAKEKKRQQAFQSKHIRAHRMLVVLLVITVHILLP